MTPQEQAEAIAREIWPEYLCELNVSTFVTARIQTVTALTKLIAENERLKNGTISGSVGQSTRQLVAQLTATEAKLETAKNFLDESETLWSYEPSKQNPDAWWNELHKLRGRIRAFLSTLTAEKKEEAK